MTRTFIYVSCGEGRELDVFALDIQSGQINSLQRLITEGMPGPMRVRPEAERLYVGLRHENALQALAMAPGSGELSVLAKVPAPGRPVYVYCDSALRLAFVPSYGDNNLSVFPLDARGEPQAVSQVVHDLPRAHCARLDATGRWLLVPTLGADAIRIYRLTEEGRLVPNDPPVMLMRAGSGPRHLIFSSDNRFVYCLDELDGHIDLFAFDAACGVLTLKQSIDMMPPGVDGKPWAAELRLTADGRFLYATERRSSTIAALAVEGETGRLTLIDHFSTESQPRGMDIDLSGRWLVASGELSDHIALHAIDPANGRLRLVRRQATGKGPICVEIAAL